MIHFRKNNLFVLKKKLLEKEKIVNLKYNLSYFSNSQFFQKD